MYAPAVHINVFVWLIQKLPPVRSNLHSTLGSRPKAQIHAEVSLPNILAAMGDNALWVEGITFLI